MYSHSYICMKAVAESSDPLGGGDFRPTMRPSLSGSPLPQMQKQPPLSHFVTLGLKNPWEGRS